MSFSAQGIMQTQNTTISDMRNNILTEVSASVNKTLQPFMERVKVAENQHTMIMSMLESHPKFIALLEENILLKKKLRSYNECEGVKININDNFDKDQVSVSDIYSEFGITPKLENKNLSEKKTVITSLPDGGSAISAKLVDFQKSLEETLVDEHELIDEFKTTFADFLQSVSSSDDDSSSVEEVEPPVVRRQTIDLTGEWLSKTVPVKQETNLNDPIQARLALSSPTTIKKERLAGVEEQETFFKEKYKSENNNNEVEDEEDDEEDDNVDEDEEEDAEEDEEESDEEEEDEDVEEEDAEEEEEESDEEDAPSKPRTAPTNEVEEDKQEESEEELYVLELEDDEGNPMEYYCNDESEMNGDIYEVLPDESPGPKVGVIKDGEIELFE